MATTDNAAEYDFHFIRVCYRHYKGEYDLNTLVKLSKEGLIQRDRFVEVCMSEASEGLHTHASVNRWDHSDFSDTKTLTLQYVRPKNKSYTVPMVRVKNVSRKKGALRIVAFDPILEIVRYFFVWNTGSGKNLSFMANSKNSMFVNGTNGIEVNSFEELARCQSR